MKTADDGLTQQEYETVGELRELLEQAWNTLDSACQRANEIPLNSVFTCTEGAKDRVEDALHHVLGLRNREPQRSKDEVAALPELRLSLEETDRLLSRVADLAEESQHFGMIDVTDSVGEAASFVKRARGGLPRGG